MLERPADARGLLVLAHGAGAGMRHPFMATIAERLTARRLATLRYQFPYIEHGKGRPDPPGILVATVRAAVARAAEEELPLLAGGKSLGGRMTSTAQAAEPLAGVRGIVFFGFPLHAPGRPGNERAAHLTRIDVPLLFLQGTRDALADLDLLRPVVASLGDRALLHVVEGGDHSFHVLKRSSRSDEDVHDEIADAIDAWSQPLTRGT